MEKDTKKVTLNIFSNCSGFACIELIALSAESFYKAFQASKESPVRIFVDPHPNVDRYEEYVGKIKSWAEENLADCSVIKTCGLSDGYIKAINMASTPYCFLTVHDVYYIPEYVDHDIF